MRVLITGASRGIGRAIAQTFARHHGPKLVVGLMGRSLAKPAHPLLEGTLTDTAREVEAHGGVPILLEADARDVRVLTHGVRNFLCAAGGLDVLVNNASALVPATPFPNPKRMDLVYEVNTRATAVCLQECREALSSSSSSPGSVVTLSPPIRMSRLEWIRQCGVPYTVSKYSMTLATLAEASDRVRANCLWPRHTVSTAATLHLEASGRLPNAYSHGRDPLHVGEAAHRLAVVDTFRNAQCVFDDDVLPDLPPTNAPLDAFAEERVTPALSC